MGAKAVVARLVAVGALVLAIGCSGENAGSEGTFKPAHAGRLTVATAFLPSAGFWEGPVKAPTGGFERDLAYAIADRLGLGAVDVVQTDFASLAGGNLAGADLAISQLTPTDERKQNLDFTTAYVTASPGVLTRVDTTPDPDLFSLQKLRWVALEGSTLTDVVNDVIEPDTAPLVVRSRSEQLAAIRNGQADATLQDLPVALAEAHAEPNTFHVVGQLSQPEELAVALPNRSGNVERIDSIVRSLVADGTVDSLSRKWLGESLSVSERDIPLIRTEN